MRAIPTLLLLASAVLAADPVISLDYVGGYTPPRARKEPYLAIDADGKIRACNPFLEDAPRESRMSKADLKKLVDDLQPKIETPKQDPKAAARVEDACITVIRVGERTARQYALDYFAQQQPKDTKLQALRSAEKRLDLIWRVSMVGGRTQAEQLRASANKALRKKWPQAKAFSLEEMTVLRECVTFRRQDKKRWIAIRVKDGKVSVEKGG